MEPNTSRAASTPLMPKFDLLEQRLDAWMLTNGIQKSKDSGKTESVHAAEKKPSKSVQDVMKTAIQEISKDVHQSTPGMTVIPPMPSEWLPGELPSARKDQVKTKAIDLPGWSGSHAELSLLNTRVLHECFEARRQGPVTARSKIWAQYVAAKAAAASNAYLPAEKPVDLRGEGQAAKDAQAFKNASKALAQAVAAQKQASPELDAAEASAELDVADASPELKPSADASRKFENPNVYSREFEIEVYYSRTPTRNAQSQATAMPQGTLLPRDKKTKKDKKEEKKKEKNPESETESLQQLQERFDDELRERLYYTYPYHAIIRNGSKQTK